MADAFLEILRKFWIRVNIPSKFKNNVSEFVRSIELYGNFN